MNLDDTIVAIATAPGRGGIGVVRLAGREALAIAAPMLRLRHPLEAGRAVLGELLVPDSNVRIDEVVITYFSKPHSYTTDDIVEISAHGSPVVLRHAVEMAIARGARLAEPGEFTMRAFLNGRLDLTQAEAVRDLIESQTLFQAKAAAQQLDGALSKRLKPIKEKLVQLIAVLEAGVDFAEDDVSVLPNEQILQRIAEVAASLASLERSFAYGKVVNEGITLAIVGEPNVGKSSLFNRLVERDRAIVTATPGTTRDLVTETVSLGGVPVKLVDTAGIRPSTDEAESIGIQKSYEALAEADLVIVVMEAPKLASHSRQKTSNQKLLESVRGRKAILVANKIDLAPDAKISADGLGLPVIPTSAVTGQGMDQLREAILTNVLGDHSSQQESGFLTNVRHHTLVKDAIQGLQSANLAVANKAPHEMLLLDLYSALRPLDSITGATSADDVLNLIFSSFCIGK